MVVIAPSTFARKAYKSRESIFTAMKRYFANNRQERASGLKKAHYNNYVKHGLSIEATARLELSGLIGTLVDATSSLFWLLYFIYSTRELQVI